MDAPRGVHFVAERVGRGRERLEELPEIAVGALVESRTGLPHVHESPAVVIESENDRAEVFAAPLWLGVPGDHALLLLSDLDLEPVAGALLYVAGCALL